jgi:CRISPR-associated protein Csd1
MLLQRLVGMPRDEGDAGPAFYRNRPMRWGLALRRDGKPARRSLRDQSDSTDPTRKAGTSFSVPYTTRTSGVAACLGADDIQYVLGWCDDKSKPSRVAACHAAFIDIVMAWAKDSPDDDAAQALSAFYDTGQAAKIEKPTGWSSKHSVLILVDDVPVTQSLSLQRFWAGEVKRRKAGGGGGDSRRGVCLVCGGRGAQLLDTLPQQLPRRLVPLATQDAALVSANKRIHTFDFSESLTTVPICVACGSQAVENLGAALADNQRSISYGGDSRLVWWTIGDTAFDLNATLSAASPETVHGLMKRVRAEGTKPVSGLETDRFCALTVSGNISRVMVRDWIDMPLKALEANIKDWFDDHELVSAYPERGPYYPLAAFVRAAGRWVPGRNGANGRYAELGAKDAQRPVDITRQLLRAALRGSPLPATLLAHLVTRIRTDGRVDDARAALLRLILVRPPHRTLEDPLMPGLDPNNRDPAYLAGRIFATVARIQYLAVRNESGREEGGEKKKLNTTFVDRYFSGAVANPRVALVQGRQLAPAWLKKIRRSNEDAAFALDRGLTELSDLYDAAGGFPGRIDIRQQATFILGYDHQRAYDFRRARELAAAKGADGTDHDD